MKTGIIYMHEFPDGSRYIGQTTTELKKRFKNGSGYKHNSGIQEKIEDFGWESVQTTILYDNVPLEELRHFETLAIDTYDTYENGLNMDRGKDHVSEEAKHKQSKAMQGENNPSHGKPRTDEDKRKIREGNIKAWADADVRRRDQSKRMKENPPMSNPENVEKHKASRWTDLKRQEHSESVSAEKNPMYGKKAEKNPNYGKKHTDEWVQKIIDVRWTPEKRAKQAERLTENNPAHNPESVAKISGDNHYTKKPDWNPESHYRKRPDWNPEKVSGDKNPNSGINRDKRRGQLRFA